MNANAYTVFETLNDRGLDLGPFSIFSRITLWKSGDSIMLRDSQSRLGADDGH